MLKLTAKTIFKSSVGSIELIDLTLGDTLIYTATVAESGDLTATIIMRILASSL
jgi:hypothetical protein